MPIFHRFRCGCSASRIRVVILTAVVATAWSALAAQAQAPAPATTTVAANPDVLGAERLFFGVDGRATRLSWPPRRCCRRGERPATRLGQGIRFRRRQGEDPDVARNEVPYGITQQALHGNRHHAVARRGKLHLDDPVEKYLPWFKAAPAGDDDGQITIEQLLSHSSGLQREAGDHWVSFEFPTEEQLKRLYADRKAAFAPSVRWKYSNLAYSVAGMVIEQVSGQKWAAYVDRNIFQPLAMTSSSVDKNVTGLTVPYGRRMPDGTRETLPFVDARGMAAATGVTSTLADMARFVSANFRRGPRGGAQVVSSGSWREMHRVRSVEENWTSGSGLGYDISRINNRTWTGHGGGYPGNTTQTLIQLDDKVGIIVLTNTNDSNPGDIARQLIATVGVAVAKVTAQKPAAVAWDDSWARFAGLYRGRGGDSHVVLLNQKLVIITPNGTNVDNPVELVPLGGGRFRFSALTGGGSVGEVVRFVEESGRPMRMYTGDGWIDRIATP